MEPFAVRLHRFALRHWHQELAILLVWAAALWLPGCATSSGARHGETPMVASWYGKEQEHKLTASGQRYEMNGYTAAHRTLPFGTILLVRNPENNKTVRVIVNDRGPYVHGRDLDLSYAAARDLGLFHDGVCRLYAKKVGTDARYDRYWKGGVPPGN